MEISISTALVIHKPSLEEQMAAANDLQRLQSQLGQIEKEISVAEALVDKMDTELKAQHAELVQELIKLREELSDLFLSRQQATQEEENVNIFDKEPEDFTVEEQEELDRIEAEVAGDIKETPQEKNARLEIQAKKLFRKISMKTHPDRTKDKRLHILFLQAKAFYEDGDLHGLEMVWNEYIRQGSGLFQSMMTRLDSVKELINAKSAKLRELLNSDSYNMAVDYSAPATRYHAVAHFKRLMFVNIEQTKQAIRSIDASRYKVEPKPATQTAGAKPGAFKIHIETTIRKVNPFGSNKDSALNGQNDNELNSPWE